ncbi:MAG: type IV pili twitching motility protein PilT [Candidatus Buchananbacteria bacterium CG10_big_fil_rev_8_21_14_0_10_42_9]|uniref:Type IV pili twitching motility protein PilT n=1 Tax=Candidatus Buchananbacteria bacterium CG10_big_fil_rev_8_21_14_0_10_42_9 TaxID=1974526 RepID=A0A2H0W3T7_9BACT|nr:MAG: type IV pili twitching motility protein PilT [Candidatus Buchananbacteria bacterium CG10_big_fil_rev_8_21_14_0_10_42_9]
MTVEEIFTIGVKEGASDVHIMAGQPPILRIDGNLQPIAGKPKLSAKDTQALAFSILTEKQKQLFTDDREFDVSYENKAKSRFRVNLFWAQDTVGMAARIIPSNIPSMEEAGMPPIVYDLMNLNQGLILVTGPTGSGKSTSLAAMIDHVNQNRAEHIITLEDPIEFIFKSNKSYIAQRQLHSDMNAFQNALVHVLRQDPNVIMVGEMRDLETIATTITLAETGHLVLATLHTHNAGQTIDRIIDIFPPHQQTQIRLQVSMTLRAVISQRLIPREGGGRIATREVMVSTPAIANLIRENKIPQIKSVIQTSAEEGMITMDQDLMNLYEQGLISKENAQFHMQNPELMD